MSLTTIDKQDIKVMIRDGIAHLPTMPFIRSEISKLEGRLDGFETRFDGLDSRVNRVEVLLEDTNSTVKVMLGMLSDNLKVKTQVDDHESRLTEIETTQPNIIATLTLHSKQLKT